MLKKRKKTGFIQSVAFHICDYESTKEHARISSKETITYLHWPLLSNGHWSQATASDAQVSHNWKSLSYLTLVVTLTAVSNHTCSCALQCNCAFPISNTQARTNAFGSFLVRFIPSVAWLALRSAVIWTIFSCFSDAVLTRARFGWKCRSASAWSHKRARACK